MGDRNEPFRVPGPALSGNSAAHARLLIPALRADQNGTFESSRSFVTHAIEVGVGGFILFGGEAASVSRLVGDLRDAASHPLLICADLERGAGQQFNGATRLPPAGAIGYLADPDITRRAGEITGREANAIGIDCIFAPVADLDSEPRNPIIGTRAFGAAPSVVAEHVVAWAAGCRNGGCIPCAKHFPGHGRTVGDSHLSLPHDDADRGTIERDLAPFRALLAEGMGAVMTAHVAYSALDPTGAPATISAPVIRDLLRGSLGFDGLVATDGLGMRGLIETMGEGAAAVAALEAGCDLLVYPTDLDSVLSALSRARESGRLTTERVMRSVTRLDTVLSLPPPNSGGSWGRAEDRRWALEVAGHSLIALRGDPQRPEARLRLIEIDDDSGASIRPGTRDLQELLIEAGYELGSSGAPLAAVYADVHAGKAQSELSPSGRLALDEVLTASPEAVVVLFGHPRIAESIINAQHLLCAWGSERLMQEAVVRRLAAAL